MGFSSESSREIAAFELFFPVSLGRPDSLLLGFFILNSSSSSETSSLTSSAYLAINLTSISENCFKLRRPLFGRSSKLTLSLSMRLCQRVGFCSMCEVKLAKLKGLSFDKYLSSAHMRSFNQGRPMLGPGDLTSAATRRLPVSANSINFSSVSCSACKTRSETK